MPGNQQVDQAALKLERRKGILATAKGRGHMDHGDIANLRQDHDEGEIETTLVDYFATPEGQTEAAKAGRGGVDPKELARLVVGGR